MTPYEILEVRDRLLAVLEIQQTRRGQYSVLEWIAEERRVMHDAVNAERLARRLPPIDVAEIARMERHALGHHNYTDKWALYCAELVQS